MPVKLKLTATEFAELSDDRKTDYVIQPDMSYKLDLEAGVFTDTQDPAALKAAIENERKQHAATKKAFDKLEAEKLEADRSKITDVEEMRASFKKELDDFKKQAEDEKKQQKKERIEALEKAVQGQLKAKALEISSKLFGTNASLMLPHVEQRLAIAGGDDPKIVIVDPLTGNTSLDQNFENFEKALSTHPSFAPMVVISHASGGGANDGGTSTGLPNGTTSEGKPKTYSDYTPGELKKIKETDLARFRELQSNR